MSEEPMIPVLDDLRIAAINQKRTDNLKLARQAKAARTSSLRNSTQRRAPERTASDAEVQGIASSGAAKRAEPAREAVRPEAPVREEPVRRVRRGERDLGWADLPDKHKKPGWDYEWKAVRVFNEPVDGGTMLVVRNAGWRPELARDWPMMVEPGTAPDAPIERQGQRLYGRPMSLTNEAKQEDIEAAYGQQRDKMQAARTGDTRNSAQPGIPNGRATRSVPIELEVYGEAGA